METFFIRALQLIFSLSILVLVHELGHFLMARLFKIRVEKFYLFFDPWFSLFKYKPKGSETEYGIGWLPLGGYVKISGMIDESLDKEQMAQPAQPWEFRSKPAWQRLLVMVAGVVMNFLLALFIYSMLMFEGGDTYIPIDKTPLYFSDVAIQAGFQDKDIVLSADGKKLERYEDVDISKIMGAKEVTVLRNGKEVNLLLPEDFGTQVIGSKMMFAHYTPTVVDSVIANMPAEKAGLQKGDSIVSVNGKHAVSFPVFAALLAQNKGEETEISFYRNDSSEKRTVSVDESGKIGIAMSGSIRPNLTTKHYDFWQSLPAGTSYGFRKLTSYVRQLKYVFTKEGASSLGGFGTIGSIFPPQWDWLRFWDMTAFLSIMLAVVNIFPIPALDGGHVMFLLYEVITGRKPSEKFLIYAQYVGMFLLLALILFANGNDIVRFFFNK
ncbi:MAG: RIP metalloprotease RseP [Candidatus Azobacteroides sp.]|nr:RIP metalloprotease RseP [Candidatus Azobacteroides sp.]